MHDVSSAMAVFIMATGCIADAVPYLHCTGCLEDVHQEPFKNSVCRLYGLFCACLDRSIYHANMCSKVIESNYNFHVAVQECVHFVNQNGHVWLWKPDREAKRAKLEL